MKTRKLASIAAAFALATTLVACGASKFSTDVTTDGHVEITAENASSGSTTSAGALTVGQDEVIVVNPIIDKGSIHLTIQDGTGTKKVYDGDVTGRIFFTVDAEPGSYDVIASPSGATGTISVLNAKKADIEAGDAALQELLNSGQLPEGIASTIDSAVGSSSSSSSK